jgi:hypothetical protein
MPGTMLSLCNYGRKANDSLASNTTFFDDDDDDDEEYGDN